MKWIGKRVPDVIIKLVLSLEIQVLPSNNNDIYFNWNIFLNFTKGWCKTDMGGSDAIY